MSTRRITDNCYACTSKATTKEHVPPRCFFPEGRREHLLTLPSCPKHNNENSADVEYTRNVLNAHVETDIEIAGSVHAATWRSFDRLPTLLPKVFKDLKPILYNGQQTGTFTVDIKSVDKVMAAIATGMYFNIRKRRFLGSWTVLCPTTYGTDEIETGKPNEFQEMREALLRIKTKTVATPHPEIFSCGVLADNDHQLIFEFQFFSGPKFYALSTPFWLNPPPRRMR